MVGSAHPTCQNAQDKTALVALFRFANPAANKHAIVVVTDNGLAWCNAATGFVKVHVQLVFTQVSRCWNGFAVVADLSQTLEWLIASWRKPVDVDCD